MNRRRLLLSTAVSAAAFDTPFLADASHAQTPTADRGVPVGPQQTSVKAAGAQTVDARSEEEWAYSVGVQTYVFSLPLTIFERERKLRLDPAALKRAQKFAPAAPINQIGNMKGLATADDIMPYTPNNDTVYSGALIELGDGPIILTVPEIPDRYCSVEVADCYTENLFYIGTRATGGRGGNHAFVGPNWKGKLPSGVIEHRVPYNSLMFALRIGVLPNDDRDLKKSTRFTRKVCFNVPQ